MAIKRSLMKSAFLKKMKYVFVFYMSLRQSLLNLVFLLLDLHAQDKIINPEGNMNMCTKILL